MTREGCGVGWYQIAVNFIEELQPVSESPRRSMEDEKGVLRVPRSMGWIAAASVFFVNDSVNGVTGNAEPEAARAERVGEVVSQLTEK